jgi:hypothetical protein
MTNQAKQRLTVWWILWAAFQTGIFVIYHFLGGIAQRPQPTTAASSAWLFGLAPVALSTILRWLVLPRAQSAQAAFHCSSWG